jgi:hypothetical protein
LLPVGEIEAKRGVFVSIFERSFVFVVASFTCRLFVFGGNHLTAGV